MITIPRLRIGHDLTSLEAPPNWPKRGYAAQTASISSAAPPPHKSGNLNNGPPPDPEARARLPHVVLNLRLSVKIQPRLMTTTPWASLNLPTHFILWAQFVFPT